MQARLHRLGGAAGPVVLFLHGFGADRFSWLAVAPMLQDVAQVWTMDLPGHGAAPDEVGDGSPLQLAQAVAAAAADLAAPAYLVGHSLGAMIAHLLHRQDPEHFPLLALIAPAGFGHGADADFLTDFARLHAPDETRALLERMVAKPRHVTPAMVTHVLTMLEATPGRRAALARIAATLNSVAPLPVADLPKGCPMIWGDADRIAPAPDGFAGGLLPGVGHVPQVEAALSVRRALRAELARLAGAQA